MDTTTTPESLLIASALSAAGVTMDTAPGAALAIMHRVMYDEPIPPDDWPEVGRVVTLLRSLADTLEGTA